MNKQDAPARIEAKSERSAHPAAPSVKVTPGSREPLPRMPLLVQITTNTLFVLTTEQSVSRCQRFSVLPRRRELRGDVRACQLASNATRIQELGILASDEQRCHLQAFAFEANGRLQRPSPAFRGVRLSPAQECCDQNAQMIRRPNVAARIRDVSAPRGRQSRSALCAGTRELRVGSA
jgi:hypothetical protein